MARCLWRAQLTSPQALAPRQGQSSSWAGSACRILRTKALAVPLGLPPSSRMKGLAIPPCLLSLVGSPLSR
eukprot:13590904-Alexandrium_andersonii.AAC.1